MRVAVLEPLAAESRTLNDWIAQYSQRRSVPIELFMASGREEFRMLFRPNCFRGVIIAAGGVEGFLEARRVRELDRECRLVVIDDSERYAIQCYRIHAVDFLIRPLNANRIFRSLDRIFY
jgi:hypothetical protein